MKRRLVAAFQYLTFKMERSTALSGVRGTCASARGGDLGNRGQFAYGELQDLYTGESPKRFKEQLVIPPFSFYWLTDRRAY